MYCTCASSFYSALILPSRFSRPGDTCPSDGESARSNERGPSVSCNFHRVGGYPLFRITGSLREVRSCRSCGSSGTIEARIKDARIRAIYVQISRHTTIDITCFPIFFSPQYRRKTDEIYLQIKTTTFLNARAKSTRNKFTTFSLL